MMDTPHDIIYRWLSNHASAEEHALLEQWLAEDPEHARVLVAQACDDALIRQRLLQQDAEQLAMGLLQDEVSLNQEDPQSAAIMKEIVEQAMRRREEQEASASTGDEASAIFSIGRSDINSRPTATISESRKPDSGMVFDHAGIQIYRRDRTESRSYKRWAWAAGLAIAAALVYFAASSGPDNPTPTPPPIAESSPGDEQVQVQQVATIQKLHEANWPGDQVLTVGSRIDQGQRVAMSAGYMQLELDRGAMVVVEAPFDLELIDDNRLRLDYGKLVATVPASANRFTVDTRTARVIDLGTEFGIEVDRTGQTSAAVFDGQVELHDTQPAIANDGPGTTRAITLNAGWAASVIPDKGLSEEARAFDVDRQVQFARAVNDASLAELAYRRQILATRPLAYWPMQGEVQSMKTKSFPNGIDLRRHGGIKTAPGLMGQGMLFTARDGDPQFLELDRAIDLSELADAQEYAISLWFQTSQRHDGVLLSFITPDVAQSATGSHHAQIALMELDGSSSIRGIHRTPPGPNPTGHELYSDEPYALDQWTHVVLTVDADAARLFVNGQLVSEVKEPRPLQGRVALRLGTIGGGDISHIQRRQFQGLVDEVAVYDHSLTEEEVSELYSMLSGLQP